MTTQTPATDVGVIVGRFQVHELHEAHKELIDTVLSNHDKVIVFLGLSPLRNTKVNPLDFNTRKKMIQESYPDMEVYYIEDVPDDALWSKNLDREIGRWTKPHQTVTLYGGRDSFLSVYKGRYASKELESTKYISGTEIRRRIGNNFPSDVKFRAGVIAASLNRYPTCYPTVDVAILNSQTKMVLMAKKVNEDKLRFVGGFADPGSPSYEADARREVSEETGVEINDPIYIGSFIIDDWRYRRESDCIKTLFFVAEYMFGRPEANDDVASVEWVSFDTFEHTPVVPEHEVLKTRLIEYFKTHNLL